MIEIELIVDITCPFQPTEIKDQASRDIEINRYPRAFYSHQNILVRIRIEQLTETNSCSIYSFLIS